MSMNRVLSFPQSQTCDGAAEFVSKRFCFSCIFSVAFVCIIVGFLLGRKTSSDVINVSTLPKTKSSYMDMNYIIRSRPNISLDENLNTTGFNETYKEAFLLWSLLRKLHLDFVSPLYREDVFISFKDIDAPDTIEINDGVTTIYKVISNYTTKYAVPSETLAKNSTSSVVKGIPVYVNYGRREDFDFNQFKNQSEDDYVALIRLGKIPIKEKAEIAFGFGVIGILFYADPEDFPLLDTSKVHHEIIPVVLGKLQLKYGNKERADIRSSMNKVDQTDTECVPVQIISADVAKKILNKMPTVSSPKGWKGEMNVSYAIKSGFMLNERRLIMKTQCINVHYDNYDMVVSITGREETDRYVIIGGHRQPMRNAQINVDKTAVLIEMIKTLSEFKYNGGGVPRRTIVFFSWGLEGLEYYACPKWMEPHMRIITERAVGYIQINNPVQGIQRLKVEATLPLHELIMNVASGIRNPNSEEISLGKLKVVDTWNDNFRNDKEYRFEMVQDYWLHSFKVPAVSMYYINDIQQSSYLDNVRDDNITSHYKEAVTYMLISIAHRLADNDLLPYKLTVYPQVLNRTLDDMNKLYNKEIARLNVSIELDKFRDEVAFFDESVNKFENNGNFRHFDDWREVDLRIRNDQVMNFNKILFCMRERYNRPLLLSENPNGLILSPVQDYLLLEYTSNAKLAIYKSLRNATLCLIDATDALGFNFLKK